MHWIDADGYSPQTGTPLPPSTPIPDTLPAAHIPLYEPSFVLDHQAGFGKDSNFQFTSSRSEADGIGNAGERVLVPTETFQQTLDVLDAVVLELEKRNAASADGPM
jgi:hypothetical protein